MPDAAQPTPVAPAPAAEAPAPAPIDPVVTKAGAPLTAASSLEDLLSADPLAGKAEVRVEIPVESGQSPTEAAAALAATPDPAVPADPAEPPAQAAPDAPEEAVDEPAAPAPAIDEAALVAQRLAEHKGLLRLKGQQAQQVGDLRRELAARDEHISALEQSMQARPPDGRPAMSEEDLTARLLEKPSDFLLTPAQVEAIAAQKAQEMIAESIAQWQDAQAVEQAAVAPEVAKDLFLARHSIEVPFDQWIASDDGKAVNDIVYKDPVRRRALEGYRDDGDIQGMANVLTAALASRKNGQKAAAARNAVNGERARIEAGKPPSAPTRPIAPPSNVPRPKSLNESWTEADLSTFLAGAEPYARED